MLPFEAILIPVYLLFADLQLHNTWAALVAPDIASPLALFLLTQFFQEIPKELDEAAYMDGASRFTVYRRVILPLATPGPGDAGHLHVPGDLERVPLAARLRDGP